MVITASIDPMFLRCRVKAPVHGRHQYADNPTKNKIYSFLLLIQMHCYAFLITFIYTQSIMIFSGLVYHLNSQKIELCKVTSKTACKIRWVQKHYQLKKLFTDGACGLTACVFLHTGHPVIVEMSHVTCYK